MKRRHARTLAATIAFAFCASALLVWASADAPALPAAGTVEHRMTDYTASPAPDLSTYGATLARPLFSPLRRPPVAKAVAAAEPEMAEAPPPVARLIAVATGPGRRVAILQLSAGGTSVVMEGEQVGGWVLSRIEPGRVTLRDGGRQAIFNLPAARGPT